MKKFNEDVNQNFQRLYGSFNIISSLIMNTNPQEFIEISNLYYMPYIRDAKTVGANKGELADVEVLLFAIIL